MTSYLSHAESADVVAAGGSWVASCCCGWSEASERRADGWSSVFDHLLDLAVDEIAVIEILQVFSRMGAGMSAHDAVEDVYGPGVWFEIRRRV